ncbi:MAG TPA: hypothetical protein VGH87_04405, partial [Polyangiaceae bacterium]
MDAPRAMDEMLTRAADDARTARVLELRAAFEARTGSFSPRDSFFEPRSAAFWDDALTSGGFGRELLPDLSAESAAMVEPFARAHRGLFRVEPEDDRFLLVDEWSGAELVAEPAGAGLRDALERVSGLVDGRVVGDPVSERIVLLPGAVFHAADAIDSIRALLPEARVRKLETSTLLDALLRMDHA